MTQAPSDLDIEAALQHPKSFFAEPKDVVAHPNVIAGDEARDLAGMGTGCQPLIGL